MVIRALLVLLVLAVGATCVTAQSHFTSPKLYSKCQELCGKVPLCVRGCRRFEEAGGCEGVGHETGGFDYGHFVSKQGCTFYQHLASKINTEVTEVELRDVASSVHKQLLDKCQTVCNEWGATNRGKKKQCKLGCQNGFDGFTGRQRRIAGVRTDTKYARRFRCRTKCKHNVDCASACHKYNYDVFLHVVDVNAGSKEGMLEVEKSKPEVSRENTNYCAAMCKSHKDALNCQKGCFSFTGSVDQCFTSCREVADVDAREACNGGCMQYLEISHGASAVPTPRNYFQPDVDLTGYLPGASPALLQDFDTTEAWHGCHAFCDVNFSQKRSEQDPCKAACLMKAAKCLKIVKGAQQGTDDKHYANTVTSFKARVQSTACAYSLGFHAPKIDHAGARTCYSFCDGLNDGWRMDGLHNLADPEAKGTLDAAVIRQVQCHRGCDIVDKQRMQQCVEQYLYQWTTPKSLVVAKLSAHKHLMNIAACSFAQGAVDGGHHVW
jgi:hypothetical protein